MNSSSKLSEASYTTSSNNQSLDARENGSGNRRKFLQNGAAVGGAIAIYASINEVPSRALGEAATNDAEAILMSPKVEKLEPSAAAARFLNSLDETAKRAANFEYQNSKREEWNFVPMTDRKGLPLKDMTQAQQLAALTLLRSVVSNSGFDRAITIMQYEGVLRSQEGPQSAARRDPLKYHFIVYSDPQGSSPWGISIEGHHLSLNYVFEGNKVLDSTPQFFGVNPASFQSDQFDGYSKGYRLLLNEEQTGWDLLDGLTKDQREQAILTDRAPAEIDSPGSAQPAPTTLQGIAAGKLDAKQQKQLRTLLSTYCASIPTEVAEDRMKIIESAGFEKIHFAWSGASKPGIGHYYKVQGPTFLIEFINVQKDAIGTTANHIHCVWRDLTGDFNLPPTIA